MIAALVLGMAGSCLVHVGESEACAVREAAAGAATATAADSFTPVAFLVGSWCSGAGPDGEWIEEHYRPPADGRMEGISRFLRRRQGGEADLRGFEYNRIEVAADGALVLTPSPSGQSPVPFRLVHAAPGEVAFENLAHDFPVRIAYRLDGGSLVARIEGTEGAGTEWRMAPCERTPFLTVPLAAAAFDPEMASAPPPSPDLVALTTWLGDAPLVGLDPVAVGGPSLEGLTARIFSHLVQGSGFRVLALEVDAGEAALLDAWVQGLGDDPAPPLAALDSSASEDGSDLLRWMRRHNRAATDPRDRLRVVGFDFDRPELAIQEILAALGGLDPPAAEQARLLYGGIPEAATLDDPVSRMGLIASTLLELPAPSSGGPWERLEVRVEVRAERGAEGILHLEATVRHAPDGSGTVAVVEDEAEILLSDIAGRSAQGVSFSFSFSFSPAAASRTFRISVTHRGSGAVEVGPPSLVLHGAKPGAGGSQQGSGPGVEVAVPPTLWSRGQRFLQVAHFVQKAHHRAEIRTRADGASVLRISSDPRLDEVLRGAREVESLLERLVAAEPEIGDSAAPYRCATASRESSLGKALQAARRVRQWAEWRTLLESRREGFLAENLLWIRNQTCADSRILVVGHPKGATHVGPALKLATGPDHRRIEVLGASRPRPGTDSPAPPASSASAQLAALAPGSFLVRTADALSTEVGRRIFRNYCTVPNVFVLLADEAP